jgi:hypothetical protein
MFMRSVIRSVLGTAAIVAAIVGCQTPAERRASDECGVLAKTFFRLPVTQQLKEFQAYSVERQYDVYICGNQTMHPPAVYLATTLASRGGEAVGFLKERLEMARDDRTIRDLVRVFTEMNRLKTYDVSGDKALMRMLVEAVSRMTNEGWKQMTIGFLHEAGIDVRGEKSGNRR